MNSYNKNLFELFYTKKITFCELKKRFDTNKKDITLCLYEDLKQAKNEHSSEDVESIIILLFECKEINRDNLIDILCELLLEPWHYKHEDIARLLQEWKKPQAVQSLFEACTMKFDYLDFDDSYALAIKCIWALGDIATKESFEKLKLLSKSNNTVIKENACHQLKKHSIT